MIKLMRLHSSEFDLLKDFEDGFCPDPDRSIAVVARNASRIIGRIFLLAPAHVEGVFVEQAWRGGPVMKQLVDAIELEARAEGITKLFAYAKDEEMAGYIERLGYMKLPMTVFSKGISCQ